MNSYKEEDIILYYSLVYYAEKRKIEKIKHLESGYKMFYIGYPSIRKEVTGWFSSAESDEHKLIARKIL